MLADYRAATLKDQAESVADQLSRDLDQLQGKFKEFLEEAKYDNLPPNARCPAHDTQSGVKCESKSSPRTPPSVSALPARPQRRCAPPILLKFIRNLLFTNLMLPLYS